MPELTDNPDEKRFESSIEGQTAFIKYITNKNGLIFLAHSGVPEKLQGQGIACLNMIGKTLTEVKNRGLKLVSLCPTIAEYIRRIPNLKNMPPCYSV